MTQGHQWRPRSPGGLIESASQKSFRGDERRGQVSQISKGMTVLQLFPLKITLFFQNQSDMQQSENTRGPNCCTTSIRMAVQVPAGKRKLS